MVINALARGGAETQLVNLALWLRRHGCQVTILTLLDDNDFAPVLAEAGIPVVCLGATSWRRVPGGILRGAQALRRIRPDAVLSFLFQATMLARIATLFCRVPVRVGSMRNEMLESRAKTLLYRWTASRDNAIVTNSGTALRTLISSGTVPKTRSRVIPNAIDLDDFRARGAGDVNAVRAAIGVPPHATMLLGVGRLSVQKDWFTLVNAFAILGSEAVYCAIAGEGDLQQELRQLIDDAGLQDRVFLLGLRHDVADLLRAADALVLSSRYEGAPNVVLEALAVERPVIATRVGACAELLGDDWDLLIPPSDPEALAAAIKTFSENPAYYARRISDRGRYLERNHSWDSVGISWAEVLGVPLSAPAEIAPEAVEAS